MSLRRTVAAALSLILLTGLFGVAASGSATAADGKNTFGSVPPDNTESAAGSDAAAGYGHTGIPAPVLIDLSGNGQFGPAPGGGSYDFTRGDSGTWWNDTGVKRTTPNTQGVWVLSASSMCTGVTPVGPGVSEQWLGMSWQWTDFFKNRVSYGPDTHTVVDVPAYNDPVTGAFVPAVTHEEPNAHPYTTYEGSTYSWSCIPPPFFELNTYMCPYRVDWNAFGPFDNPDKRIEVWDGDASTVESSLKVDPVSGVTSPSSQADSGSITTAWERSRLAGVSRSPSGKRVVGPGAPYGDLSLCSSAWDLSVDRTEWGKYYIESDAYTKQIVVREYTTINQETGVWPDSVVTSFGEGAAFLGVKSYWQQACDFANGWVYDGNSNWRNRGKTFTSLDCPSARLSCPVPNLPTMTYSDGTVTAPGTQFEVLADGQNNTLTYDPVAPVGDVRKLDTGGRTMLQISDDSQPWRGRAPGEVGGGITDANADDQFFKTTPPVDLWQKNADGSSRIISDFDLQFFRATFTDPTTEKKMPWGAQPWWWYSDAEIKSKAPAAMTGAITGTTMSATPVTTWAAFGRALCYADPVDVYSLRPRISE